MSSRRSVRPLVRLPLCADGKAAGGEFGEERLHIAQDGLAGRRIAHMADAPRGPAAGRWSSRSRSDRRPGRGARSEWKRSPSKVTMPAASWPRCWSACRPSAVRAAASSWPKMPKTPHSSRSLSPSRSKSRSIRRRNCLMPQLPRWSGPPKSGCSVGPGAGAGVGLPARWSCPLGALDQLVQALRWVRLVASASSSSPGSAGAGWAGAPGLGRT